MALHTSVLLFLSFFNDSPSSIIVFVLFLYNKKSLLVVFLALNGRIAFSWNPRLNVLMWSNWILLLQLWIGIRLWVVQIYVFCHPIIFRRNKWIVFIYCCSGIKVIMGPFFCGVLGFQYEFYFDYALFLFHTQYRKKCFMRFYHGDWVGVHYKVQVDIVISGRDNHWWKWMLPENSNSVLDCSH